MKSKEVLKYQVAQFSPINHINPIFLITFEINIGTDTHDEMYVFESPKLVCMFLCCGINAEFMLESLG